VEDWRVFCFIMSSMIEEMNNDKELLEQQVSELIGHFHKKHKGVCLNINTEAVFHERIETATRFLIKHIITARVELI